jgi:hypothetical protein
MPLSGPKRALPLALPLLPALFAVTARAETTACQPIPSLPYTISAPGIYCLTTDLSTSMTEGRAITIEANSVVLDLNGHKLGGLGAGPGSLAVGIYALDRENITIRNGTIRGFFAAVLLAGASSRAHLVEDLRADRNTRRGLQVEGFGSLVRRNQVLTTGGSTSGAFTGINCGILATGSGHRIVDNDVVAVLTQETPFISAQGIHVEGSEGIVMANRVVRSGTGISMAGTFEVRYRDNTVTSAIVAYVGGIDAGDNR